MKSNFFSDCAQECHNLVGVMFVVVTCKFGFGQIYGFLSGNINVQIFYIECEGSVVDVNV